MKKTEKKVRVSNRTYPPKLCRKPDCNLEFTPTDGRQVYCCAQHRIDSNNDKRKVIDKLESDFQKKVKHNRQVLVKIEKSGFYIKHGIVNKSLLLYEGFEFSIYHKIFFEKNSKREVLVNYDYGLMLVDSMKENFKIIKL
jgi:hypothetical protein